MKKIFALILAVMVAVCCTFAAAAADQTFPSPTAPTIIPPKPTEPPTGELPTLYIYCHTYYIYSTTPI